MLNYQIYPSCFICVFRLVCYILWAVWVYKNEWSVECQDAYIIGKRTQVNCLCSIYECLFVCIYIFSPWNISNYHKMYVRWNERARKEHILFKLGDNEVHFSTHVWCWPTFNHLMNKMVEFVLCLLQKKKKQLTHMCICIAAVRMHGLFAAFRHILLFKFENFYLPQLCHTCICHYPPLRETFFPTERFKRFELIPLCSHQIESNAIEHTKCWEIIHESCKQMPYAHCAPHINHLDDKFQALEEEDGGEKSESWWNW